MKRLIPILVALLSVIMAVGTFVQRSQGADMAIQHIYHSWWFVLIWVVLMVASAVMLVQWKLFKRPVTFGIHLSFAFIVVGMILTVFTAQSGRMTLYPGQSGIAFTSQDKAHTYQLPFGVTLNHFDIQYYPGTQAPADFVSTITLNDHDGANTTAKVSMNHICRHQGYRFYQSGYSEDGAVILTVSHDPWGIAFNYIGYFLLIVSMLGFFFDSHSRFRQLLKSPLLRQGAATIVFLMLSWSASAQPKVLPEPQAEALGRLYVHYNDRICPLQTLARDFTVKLYGSPTYKGYTSEQVLSGWIFFFDEWQQEPIIKIKGSQVRSLMGLEGRYASLSDFYNANGEYQLRMLDTMALDNPRRSKLMAADEKFQLISMLYNGQLLKLFPIADSTGAMNWYSQSDKLPFSVSDDEYLFVRKSLSYSQELVVTHDLKGLDTLLSKIRQYQVKKAGDQLPCNLRFRTECLYNTMMAGKPVAMASIFIGLVFFIIMLVYIGNGKSLSVRVRFVGIVLLAIQALYLLALFVMRWIISGYIPLSNGYETMLFLALCIAVLALCLTKKFPLATSFGMLLTGLAMMVAMMGGANPSVTQLMPVLQSPLLCIHVAIIMLAYSLLAFVMLDGIAAIVIQLRNHNSDAVSRLQVVSQIMLYPAVFLLAIGIFVGAMWANVSWGTYWSWDPKEVWALITLLVYAVLLHGRSAQGLQRPMAFHIYCVVAFFCVLFTYFGVNFLIGGMHSYA